ncbi:hypothetical protein EI555_011209, partial [Monodon monoceros]
AITIIYLALISHHEIFPDIYKFLEIESGLRLEVEGKMVSRTEDNIDGNVLCCTFFIGENMNLDSVVALLDSCEDGMTPFMIFLMDGLEMEKC